MHTPRVRVCATRMGIYLSALPQQEQAWVFTSSAAPPPPPDDPCLDIFACLVSELAGKSIFQVNETPQ